ncbi:unnamed protein product [Arctia plantaginis]|uniref:Carboxylesterase type B domain-containing protein n=1 Tax=Arctia plantaginis TaxID=874455 RepID=A0A8S0ZZ57_ARCPL|nr:unnamed protein product [Arctia plantaginis]
MINATHYVGAIEHGNDEWLEVKIEQGPVRGQLDSGGELWTFLNLPYATAPTGRNQFKAPLPPPTWTETYEAIDRGVKYGITLLKQVSP